MPPKQQQSQRIIFEDADGSLATSIDRESMRRILEPVLTDNGVQENNALDGFLFNASGDPARTDAERFFLLFYNASHPLAKIRQKLDIFFNIKRIPITHAFLRDDINREIWCKILASLNLPYLVPGEIDRYQKQLLKALWDKIKVYGVQQQSAAAAASDFTAENLGQWFVAVARLSEDDNAAKEFIKTFAADESVQKVTSDFQSFLKRSSETTSQLDYGQEDQTLQGIASLFDPAYSLNQEEDSLKVKFVKELLKQLLKSVSTKFIVETVRSQPSVDLEAKIVIVSMHDSNKVENIPFVKPELKLSRYKNLEELCDGKEYLEMLIKQYLAIVDPLELLIALHDNASFEFARDSAEIKYLLQLARHPLLMEACAKELFKIESIKQYLTTILQFQQNDSDYKTFKSKTLEMLQQFVVFYLKYSGILSSGLVQQELPTVQKYRQALLFLINLLEQSKLWCPTEWNPGQKKNLNDYSCYLAEQLRYVALTASDIHSVSLAKLPENSEGEFNPVQLIAAVLTSENIEYSVSAFSGNRVDYLDGARLTFKNTGLLVFTAQGRNFESMASQLLQRLCYVTLNSEMCSINAMSFDSSFFEMNAEDKTVVVHAVGIPARQKVLVFEAKTKRDFIEQPVFLSANVLPTVSGIKQVECPISHVAAFRIKFPGNHIVFAGIASQPREFTLFPVGDLKAMPNNLDNFLREFYSNLLPILSRKLLPLDRRNMIALLSFMRHFASSELSYHSEWSIILDALLSEGNEGLLDYKGDLVSKHSEWLRFYLFTVIAVAAGVSKFYHHFDTDEDLTLCAAKKLIDIFVVTNPASLIFLTTLVSGGVLYISGEVLRQIYYLFKKALSHVRILQGNGVEQTIQSVLQRVNASNRDPAMIARLATAAGFYTEGHTFGDLYGFLHEVEKQLKYNNHSSGALYVRRLLMSGDGKDRYVSETEKFIRNTLAGVSNIIIAPAGLGFSIYMGIKTISVINSPTLYNFSTDSLNYMTKLSAFLFGDGTDENPGLAPPVALFLLFLLFNMSWLLDYLPRGAQSVWSGVKGGASSVSNCCSSMFYCPPRESERLDRVVVTPVNDPDEVNERSGLIPSKAGCLSCFK